MPIYEYHCPSCRRTFELLRPMAGVSDTATCPSGHAGATRILSLVATPPRGARQPAGPDGCACGGNCACGR